MLVIGLYKFHMVWSWNFRNCLIQGLKIKLVINSLYMLKRPINKTSYLSWFGEFHTKNSTDAKKKVQARNWKIRITIGASVQFGSWAWPFISRQRAASGDVSLSWRLEWLWDKQWVTLSVIWYLIKKSDINPKILAFIQVIYSFNLI